MVVDDVLLKLGNFGRWQAFYFFTLGIFTYFPLAFQFIAIVFIGYKPAHHCMLDNQENVLSRIPVIDGKASSCNVFLNESNETSPCYDGWTYPDYEGSTIVTQWDLVCQQGHMAYMTQLVLVAGMIGSLVFSYISDRIGRKKVFLFCQIGLGIVGTMTAFSVNLLMFMVLRLITGAFLIAILLVGFLWTCEMFPAQHRTLVACLIQIFWIIGSCLLAGLAYLIHDWRYLQFLISVFSFLFIPFNCILRESLLWDFSNGKIDDVEETLRIAARMNGLTLQEPILKREINTVTIRIDQEENIKKDETNDFNLKMPLASEEINSLTLSVTETQRVEESKMIKYCTMDLLKNKTMFLYLFIISSLWTVNALVYYGLVLSTAVLSGNRFINAFLSSLVELPAHISSYFALTRFGRKKSLLVYQCMGGVFLLMNAYLDRPKSGFGHSHPFLILLFNNLGKFGISASFAIVVLYCAEIFPTNIRNTASGISSVIARAGNLLAVLAAYLAEDYSWACMGFFGFISVLTSFMVLLLPETLNKTLPHTIEEACNLGKKNSEKKKKESDQ